MAKIRSDLDPGRHVAKFKQTKLVEKKIEALRKWGRHCGSVGEPTFQTLSQSCFHFADHIENRRGSLDGVDADFLSKARAPLEDHELKIARSFPVVICYNLIVQGCGRLSDQALEKLVFASTSGKIRRGGFGFGKQIHGNDAETMVSCQRAAIIAHIEKICKLKQSMAFVLAAENFTGDLSPEDDADLERRLEQADTSQPVTSETKFICGSGLRSLRRLIYKYYGTSWSLQVESAQIVARSDQIRCRKSRDAPRSGAFIP